MIFEKSALFKQESYIDGEWISSPDTLEVIDPSSQQLVGTVPSLGEQETLQAIHAAHRAFLPWKNFTAKERSVILKNWHKLIVDYTNDLAVIMSKEQGKPLAEAEREVVSCAAYVEWFAEEAKRVYGDTIPMSQKGKRIVVLKEPIGVCAAITPWNFPLSTITRKAAPALAAGCTVIVKPSSYTPFSALALAVLADKAGFPPGVINVITGKAEILGKVLTSSHLVKKISFTGSTEVGRVLMRDSSDSLKKISLELGGHAPFIVFEDADIELAVTEAMISKFRNSGQTCVCANRFLVQESIFEEFSMKFIEMVRSQLVVGPGLQMDRNQGPLIDGKAVEKVEYQIQDALAKGARLATGGKRIAGKGFFFEPTVILDVTSEMRIAQEETFGPVAPLFRFKTEDEALRIANDSQYGLAAYFFTKDLARVWRMTERLECGMVGINTGILSSEAAPFGGTKDSGMGREGSKYGIEEYLELKYMCIGGLT
ncbi:MAG: NAD-dependent succinate-semialdehyde dehydrogenase [Desulfobulbaceae bacterium]|nr:MAG: NAD-dependent succinate-semialdehyde dehydrogenase [Desulfobulbaceae bacterium]